MKDKKTGLDNLTVKLLEKEANCEILCIDCSNQCDLYKKWMKKFRPIKK